MIAINEEPANDLRTYLRVNINRHPEKLRTEFSDHVTANANNIRHNDTEVSRICRTTDDRAHRFLTDSALCNLKAPMNTRIERRLSTAHRRLTGRRDRSVTNVILNNRSVNFTCAIPIRKTTRRNFNGITVKLPINPLTLSLRTNDSDVVPSDLFFRTGFARTKVTRRRVTRSGHRLRCGFPVNVLSNAIFLLLKTILIPALISLAVLLTPDRYLHVFFIIMSALIRATRSLNLISAFVTRTGVLLRRILVGSATNGARTLAACQGMTLTTRRDCNLNYAYPARCLLHRVNKSDIIIGILRVIPVGAGNEGSLLYIADRCDDRVRHAKTFNPVRTPCYLEPIEIRVRDLEAVTPR